MTTMDGVIVVDKPTGVTSHDVVRRMRKLTGQKRVGHLGTLDPLATGVLPLVVGRYTRLAQFFSGHDRSYDATIRFGFATDSYDAEGEIVGPQRPVNLSREQVDAALERYRGTFAQTPPPVSAKKVGGVRAYKLARNKQDVALKPSEVTIYALELLSLAGNEAGIRMSCSTGTYVRSLAHDLGRDLGCGAHITALRRTAMGEFTEDMAVGIDELEQARDEGRLEECFQSGWTILPEIPTHRVDEQLAARISHGRDFRVSPFGPPQGAKMLKAVNRRGQIIAVAEARMPRVYHPIVVL